MLMEGTAMAQCVKEAYVQKVLNSLMRGAVSHPSEAAGAPAQTGMVWSCDKKKCKSVFIVTFHLGAGETSSELNVLT